MVNTIERASYTDTINQLLPGSKIIRLIGYSRKNTDYSKAKHPAGKWRDTPSLTEDEIQTWTAAGGWIGATLPKGRFIIDVDTGTDGALLKELLEGESLSHHSIKTPNGWQFIFNAAESRTSSIHQVSRHWCAIGIKIDTKPPGKGYIVFPTDNTTGRELAAKSLNELDELPEYLHPVWNAERTKDYDFPIPLQEGSRNNTLYEFARRLHSSDTDEDLLRQSILLIYEYFMPDKADFPREDVEASIQSVKALERPEKEARTTAAQDFRAVEDEDYTLEFNDRGSVKPNSRNAETILLNDPFKDVIAYDTFKGAEVIKGDLPWRKREQPNKPYEQWLGSDDRALQHYFGVNYDFKPSTIIDNAFQVAIRKNSFHPVKDYLEAQTWDGIPRAETVFIDHLGAADTPYIRAVTRKWLAAAVSRIYEPGCKFDYMPVLVGPQGVGKSSVIAALGRQWFSDSLKNLESKEAGEHLRAGWIFEFDELAAMRRNEVEEIKAFLTKQTDTFRVAYDRVVSDFPRKSVFIGTTNTSGFLRDQTGNRRFWAITTDTTKQKYGIGALTDEVVGQIWAEVMTIYKQGEKLYLSDELEAVARQIQDSHMEEDPRAGLIREYLDTRLPVNWDNMELYERRNYLLGDGTGFDYAPGETQRVRVCAAEIWAECLGNDHKNMKPFEARDVCTIIRKMGWEERVPSRTTFKHYGKQTTFVRVES